MVTDDKSNILAMAEFVMTDDCRVGRASTVQPPSEFPPKLPGRGKLGRGVQIARVLTELANARVTLVPSPSRPRG